MTASSRARTVLAAALLVITILLSGAGALLTTRLYADSPLAHDTEAIVDDALPRLTFLRHALDRDSATRMQTLFPEGHFFSYVLYGLTWVDVGARDPELREEALAEARWALSHLDSPAGQAPFSARLDPPYGVFYAGWSTWLRGGVVRLGGAGDPEAARFFADAEALAAAFTDHLDTTGSPYLPAYPGQAWPVDSAVGLAAVRLADHLRDGEGRYEDLIARWWEAADARRDPATGLLPHRVHPQTGYPVEGARATSQTLILRFLREVDPEVAARDWRQFRELFTSTVPGVPGIREHPHGVHLPGDIDSGPLVFGMSASASVVALGTAVLFADDRAATALSGLSETTGFAVQIGQQRRYLAGVLPVGDAFLAWSRASDGWIVPAGDSGTPMPGDPSGWWRLPWHLLTVAFLTPWWAATLIVVRLFRRPPSASQDQQGARGSGVSLRRRSS